MNEIANKQEILKELTYIMHSRCSCDDTARVKACEILLKYTDENEEYENNVTKESC